MLSSSLSIFTSPISFPTPHRTRFRPPRATTTTSYNYNYNYNYSYSFSTDKNRSSFTYLSPHGTAAACTSMYEILGIPVWATGQEIKKAYRRLARICHPDVAAIDLKDSSADEFMKIHAAYCTLSDPEKRAVYDSKLFRRNNNNQPLTDMSAAFCGYGRRNWETDQCW